ncbi:phosphate ABC transporter permease PstA [Spiroplasma poulsonii]|uniref:Phosphate transport system permease protein PstA n=1 Tax=Spiroplasma poulsonii TaxID=2138 RepID=A0A2P6FBK2_9MOLU|nr:phosphate ABC transporter permease PstA [Spiroplasma poulsonii]KAF0851225.1 Phosphate transport system permease protein PstA [Spiroplasma poulsonii]PQM30820.1 Phosphate transport system permease protein PstA [Spiroplasma poulsonii]PWF95810.1 Phosphate transport system permease protein PstA [Spiroplasma poulsonii]PWF98589.1 Phosphate transport system permease protein PstA [Spiroplasma poulsonii]
MANKDVKEVMTAYRKPVREKMRMWRICFANNFRGRKQLTDFGSKIIIYSFAILTILILLTLVGFIIYKSIYFFQHYPGGFWGFLSGQTWNANNNQFGIWRIVIATFFVLLIALLFAIPLTIFSSLYISEYLSPTIKRRVIGIIQLLAGIPSVVFGLFALAILGPLFMLMGAPSTSNLLVTSITLAFMGLPIMISLSINALENVPDSYRFGSLALGLSKTHTTYRIVLRSAWFKIITAIMMGVARIIGETMAVMMIAGNAPDGLKVGNGFLNFIFSSIATLASTIGLEMLENSGPMYESALYAIGLVLFIIVCIINIFIISSQAFNKRKRNYHTRKTTKSLRLSKSYNGNKINKLFYERIKKTRGIKKFKDGLGMFFLISSTVIVVFFTLIILITIIWKGLFGMVWHDLISTSTFDGGAGILSTFFVTLLLVICSMIFAVPLGLMVAIYLNEYARQSSIFAKAVRFAIDVLSSTPSIIYGTFGLAFFIGVCRLPLSVLASGLTLTIVILPIMIRSIEEALAGVENSMRNASLALGANKTSTTLKVVLPNAMPGIVTAIILAIGRVIGESAPVYLTLGTAVRLPIAGFMSPGASMTTQILMLSKEGATADAMRIMFELAFAIMVLIWLSNSFAHILGKKFAPNYVKIGFKQKWKMRINSLKFFFSKENYLHQKENVTNFWRKIGPKKKQTAKEDKDDNKGEQ